MAEFSQAVASNMASKGRGGDNQIAHVGTGEVVIPARVLDENPGFVGQVVKAMQNSGLDWRRYMVGADKNSKNPSTGQPEFFAGGMDSGIGDSARDSVSGGAPEGGRDGPSDAYRSEMEGMGFGVGGGGGGLGSYSEQFRNTPLGEYNPAGRMLGGMMDAGARAGGVLGDAFEGLGGVRDDPIGGRDGPEGGAAKNAPQPAMTPPSIEAPVELGFDPAMDDLQRRAAIATFGINSDDSLYRDPATQDYYKSLIFDAIQNGGVGALLPIERQYIEQVLGIPVGDDLNSLITALYG